MELRILDSLAASFSVRTDELLTAQPAIVPASPELPIVMSLVDPGVRKRMSDAKWRWRERDGGACPAESCEIVLQPPIDAFDAVIGVLESDESDRPVALVSALNDTDTFAVLQHSPRIRFLVLPPETASLGRVAQRSPDAFFAVGAVPPPDVIVNPSTVPPPYSGDLGYGAVLNQNTPEVTEIWARPEWFAETVHEMFATVWTDTWRFDKARHNQVSVPGYALCASSSGQTVKYYLGKTGKLDDMPKVDKSNVVAEQARYAEVAADIPYDRAVRIPQGGLWTDLDSFAAMTLDGMRRGLNTELALIPAGAIDENQLVYLRKNRYAPSQALSRVFLDRVLFHAGAVVRVRVTADALFDTVNTILTAGRAQDVKYCLSGFGTTSCGTSELDAQHTLLNGRELDRNRLYTIAMPEDVALEHALPLFGDQERDLVDLIDAGLARRSTGSIETCSAGYHNPATEAPANTLTETLATRLEKADAGLRTMYLYIKPAEVSFSETQVSEPAGGQGLFDQLPVENSGARPSRRFAVNVGVDAGLIDSRHWAIRALGTFSYGHETVSDQTSIDPNVLSGALRVDWKVPALSGRFFAGGFVETQLRTQASEVQATRTISGIIDPDTGTRLGDVTEEGPTVSLATARREYDFIGVGFEIDQPQLTSWLTLDPLRVTFAYGRSRREHVDVQIGGQSQSLALFQQIGAAGLLSRYYETHLDTLTSKTEYKFIDAPLRRDRIQVDVTPDITWKLGGRDLNITLATRYRRFVGPNLLPLSEHQSLTANLTLAIPISGLASLNLGTSQYMVQVNGIRGWFKVWQPSVSLSIPVLIARRAGIAF